MKLLKSLILLAFVIGIISSCGKDELDASNLNGTRWVEQDGPNFTGSNHIFEFFDNNTFTLELSYWTDILVVGQECPDNRTDYIKGTYTISSNTLSINGQYSDEDFQNEEPNCNGVTTYGKIYMYEYDGDDWILNSDLEEEYLQIRLVKQ